MTAGQFGVALDLGSLESGLGRLFNGYHRLSESGLGVNPFEAPPERCRNFITSHCHEEFHRHWSSEAAREYYMMWLCSSEVLNELVFFLLESSVDQKWTIPKRRVSTQGIT